MELRGRVIQPLAPAYPGGHLGQGIREPTNGLVNIVVADKKTMNEVYPEVVLASVGLLKRVNLEGGSEQGVSARYRNMVVLAGSMWANGDSQYLRGHYALEGKAEHPQQQQEPLLPNGEGRVFRGEVDAGDYCFIKEVSLCWNPILPGGVVRDGHEQ